MISVSDIKTDWTVAHVCCGSAGGAIGFGWAKTEFRGVVGTFRNLYGIDVDPNCCQDFEDKTGVPAYCLDLFDRQMYIDFWGHEPPAEWREVTPDDICALSNGISPDMVFFSAPCKGFSGLLSEKKSKTKEYQALNKLYWRIVWLYLMAFPDDPPAMIISENVPRVKSRGKDWVAKVKKLGEEHGFVHNSEDHCCGEIGGLAEKRNRNMLVMRNPEKCPVYLYKPDKKPYKTIGEVIGPLPLPGDTKRGGKMHKIPHLQWKVWMRLALIPPGGDWRDLEKNDHTQYRLTYTPRNGAGSVADWNKPCGAVTGAAGYGRSNSVQAISDLRFRGSEGRHRSHYAVVPFDGVAGTVTGASHVGNGRLCMADVRLKERQSRHPEVYRIDKWDEPARCVTGTRVGSGALMIADERYASGSGYTNKHKILGWNGQATTVTGERDVQAGAQSIADPRVKAGTHSRPHDYGVLRWEGISPTVRGVGRTMNSAVSIADPRLTCKPRTGTYGVNRWDSPGPTVIGSGDVHAGAVAVADERDQWMELLGPDMTPSNIKKMIRSLRRDGYLGGKVVPFINTTLAEAIQHVYERDAAGYWRVPDDEERGVWVILSPHGGAWHRPLTTYELAAIQSFPLHNPDGTPFTLVGNSDASHRERIGNAVPPLAAKAIAETMLVSLMASSAGEEFIMSASPIWVVPEGSDGIALVH